MLHEIVFQLMPVGCVGDVDPVCALIVVGCSEEAGKVVDPALVRSCLPS